jgi:hypothetical protein
MQKGAVVKSCQYPKAGSRINPLPPNVIYICRTAPLTSRLYILNTGCAKILKQGLISGPRLGTEATLLLLNRIQSRVVTGLLTVHNTLRRHLHSMGLSDRPLCRKCGAQDATLAHILCRCKALALLTHAYLGSFFVVKGKGHPITGHQGPRGGVEV